MNTWIVVIKKGISGISLWLVPIEEDEKYVAKAAFKENEINKN